jgi:hypothetical protein
MNMTFVYTSQFKARWDSQRLTDEDLQALETMLMNRPEAGDVLSGTDGARKVRFAPPSRHTGKSGAFRIGYAYVKIDATIYVLAMLIKNRQPNFTDTEKASMKSAIAIITAKHKRW